MTIMRLLEQNTLVNIQYADKAKLQELFCATSTTTPYSVVNRAEDYVRNCSVKKTAGNLLYLERRITGVIENWRLEYNTFEPQSSLNYRPPAPETWFH